MCCIAGYRNVFGSEVAQSHASQASMMDDIEPDTTAVNVTGWSLINCRTFMIATFLLENFGSLTALE